MLSPHKPQSLKLIHISNTQITNNVKQWYSIFQLEIRIVVLANKPLYFVAEVQALHRLMRATPNSNQVKAITGIHQRR